MMNWTIFSGDNLIYDRNIVDENGERFYELISPVLSETCKGFNSLAFSAKPHSAAIDHLEKLYPYVRLKLNGSLYWKGRVISDTPDIYGTHKYYVEDFLAVLRDSVCRPFSFFGTVEDFLEMLVTSHNEQVKPFQQISAVDCDVSSWASTGNITRSSESFDSTWGVIKSKLLNPLGGYMWISYDAQENATLHYSASQRDTSTQTIELGANLASIAIKNTAEQFYTACVPLGQQDQDTKEYLRISDINEGRDYLINEVAASQYGVIFAPIADTTWDDVTLNSNLLTRGNQWLQEQSAKAVQQIDLTAVDLGSQSVENFLWLDAVRTIVPSRGLDALFVIESISRQLDNPASVKIKLNYSGRQLTGNSAASTASNAKKIQEIVADYTTSGDLTELREEIIRQTSYIEQRANEIIAGALQEYTKTEELGNTDAFRTLEESIRSQLSILANEVSIQFTEISNTVTQQGNNTTAEFSKYEAWFRFLSSGLVIGRSTSPIQMKLENEVLYFCTDPETVTMDTAIAYFAAGALNVNFINVRNLTIGYAGQWLDIRVVGTGDNIGALFSGRLS